jgi:hypothetical protein
MDTLRKPHFLAEVERVFGTATRVSLELAASPQFSGIYRSVHDAKLPGEIAFAMARMSQDLDREVERLEENPSLTEQARRGAMDALRAQARQAVAQLVGAKASEVIRKNESWLGKENLK